MYGGPRLVAVAVVSAMIVAGCAGEGGSYELTAPTVTNPPGSVAGASAGTGGSVTSMTVGVRGGNGGPGVGGNNGTIAATCGVKTFGLDKVTPDLLVVLDKSGSMGETPDGQLCLTLTGINCGPTSKWPQMTAAINQVVGQTDGSIRWGLKLFPEDFICGISTNIAVPVADQTSGAIRNVIAAVLPNGGTPTRGALAGASLYLSSLNDGHPKYILLATDGEPNCGVSGDQNASDAAAAVSAVRDSVALGIPVFVVGIGNVVDAQATLAAMAVAGGRPQAKTPSYYPVSNTADLVSVLGTIGGLIDSCSFNLGSVPPDPSNVAVTADGTKVPADPTHRNGWDYAAGQTAVQLYGSWCDASRAGQVKDIKATYGCPGIIVN
ncbi:MAG: hypothetical protein QOI66_4973 [Myxococcales bacterium]|nr:hypothetical protein [Myxococcales bacterium]